jgi:hypothetical protein
MLQVLAPLDLLGILMPRRRLHKLLKLLEEIATKINSVLVIYAAHRSQPA